MPTSSEIHALLIEDDARIAELLVTYLGDHSVEVTHVATGDEGARQARAVGYDIVLLDLMLPGLDGLSVCRSIREHSRVPIIMITALGDEPDRVSGLEIGADDYMVKPISARELLARIRALLRRATEPKKTEETLRVGDLTLDRGRLEADVAGVALSLTAYEFALLAALAESAGRALGREQLLEIAKGSLEESFDRSIDVQISRLRKKLGDSGRAPRRIKTIRGVGYMLVAAETQ